MLVTPAGNAYYPDVFVVCGGQAERHHETGASLIVEVLSSSSVDIDRREKTAAYAQIPGLEVYLLVHPEVRRVEAAITEQGKVKTWQAFGPGMVVPTRFASIDIDALYGTLDRIATAS